MKLLEATQIISTKNLTSSRFFNIDARLNADDLLLWNKECDHQILLREHCIKCKERIDKIKRLIKNYDFNRKHNLKYMLGGFDSTFADNLFTTYIADTLRHVKDFIKEMNLQNNKNNQEVLKAIESLDDIRQNAQRKEYSLTEQKIENYDSKDIQEEACSLTKQQCEYYDPDDDDDYCYYGAEGIKYFKENKCPRSQ